MGNTEAFVEARNLAEQTTDAQERNRIWWETLPMTYNGWDKDKKARIPTSADDFMVVERAFLDGNPWLKEQFNFNGFAGKRVLEIGCGSGVATCLFAKGGANVTAVDLTQQSIDIATRNAAAQGVSDRVRLMQMDAEKLEFPDSSFDHAFTWGVLHHSARTQDAIKQVGRVLVPGGTGLIMVYNRSSLRYWLKGAYWLFAKGKVFQGYNMQTVQGFATDGYYQRHFSHGQLRAMLADAGLRTTATHASHINKKYITALPTAMDPWLKRNFGWLLIGEFQKPGR